MLKEGSFQNFLKERFRERGGSLMCVLAEMVAIYRTHILQLYISQYIEKASQGIKCTLR